MGIHELLTGLHVHHGKMRMSEGHVANKKRRETNV
jgi:hypothetical protein